VTDLDYGRFDALTFDCYGTLIDWEAGILTGLRSVLAGHAPDLPRSAPGRDAPYEHQGNRPDPDGRNQASIEPSDDELLKAYAAFEAGAEAGPYRRYRDILVDGLRQVTARYGIEPDEAELARFSDSVGDWPAFPDSAAALARLHERFKLGVITNCDDDLFARSAARLKTTFDWVVTAQTAGSYKPDPHNFEVAFERIRLPRERILHVAQSLFHDHVTAKRLGLATVWIDRRHDRPGFGATPPADARPDATFRDMASFAEAALADATLGADVID
jgi:2-haloacid dehalogenase